MTAADVVRIEGVHATAVDLMDAKGGRFHIRDMVEAHFGVPKIDPYLFKQLRGDLERIEDGGLFAYIGNGKCVSPKILGERLFSAVQHSRVARPDEDTRVKDLQRMMHEALGSPRRSHVKPKQRGRYPEYRRRR